MVKFSWKLRSNIIICKQWTSSLTYVCVHPLITPAGAASILTVAAGCLVPFMFLKEVIKRYDASKGLRHAFTDVFSPTSEWSPKDPVLRQEYHNLHATENRTTAQQLSN